MEEAGLGQGCSKTSREPKKKTVYRKNANTDRNSKTLPDMRKGPNRDPQ